MGWRLARFAPQATPQPGLYRPAPVSQELAKEIAPNATTWMTWEKHSYTSSRMFRI